jgi:hypothetical protein
MKQLNFFIQMSKYNHKPAAVLFSYYNRGKWRRKFNCDYRRVFKPKNK